MHKREASSLSSGSVKQRLHFGELIPILHCNCGNELTLQTSWSSENPGRRFWNCVGINGMHSCGFFAWFDPPMCLRSKKIIPELLKRVNRNEEEIERLKASKLRTGNGPKNECNVKWLKGLLLLALGVVIGLLMSNVVPKKCSQPTDFYRLS
ncbi:uncharacterized protein LOC115997606 [Ipomoea triloba]|uniref:uncharacterized protein LOC115997606 n=1 Tax=Ipomoea triloba TaxID=35885 RepID=UPI00125D911F|nr:uncharacterized protein LOC115997606 [Ipomoea triloba]